MKIIATLSLIISTAAVIIALRAPRPRATVLPSLSQRGELDDVRARLRESDSKLAEVSGRLVELEKRHGPPSQSVSPVMQKATAPSLPMLVGGSFAVEQNAVVYSPDAKLRLGSDVAVRSPTGVMVSDLEQQIIVGDLAMETPRGTTQANGAVIDVRKKTMSAERMVFTNESSKTTDAAAMPPTTQEPR
jgi:hypothetical protein